MVFFVVTTSSQATNAYGPFASARAAEEAAAKYKIDGRDEVDDADGNNVTTYKVVKLELP